MADTEGTVYSFPPMSLLDDHSGTAPSYDAEDVRVSAHRIQEALTDAYVDARILDICVGPLSIRYEISLNPGVHLSRVQRLSSDIAFALGVQHVHIAPVVGKFSIVGIDVPRTFAETISLRKVMDTPVFRTAQSPLSFALGQSSDGTPVVCDLNKERHLLIGGTTGAGKSVMIHALIMSLLYHASPDEVRFVMADTKGLELTAYHGIPHLMVPVITDPQKAKAAFHWLEAEMQRRYQAFFACGARSLDSYHQKMPDSDMPHIVAIADDLFHLFADMDQAFEACVHNLILRGHIVVVHLVLSTQHAYTGTVVKLANLRNAGRIAFALPSRLDSIPLLGTDGAEQLSGQDELLYLSIDSRSPQRVQGCLVTDPELERTVRYVKDNNVPGSVSMNTIDIDPLLLEAVEVVLETGQASVSMLQRRLKLGYSRASRLVDEMSAMGIVEPPQGYQPRKVIISKEQWIPMRSQL